MARFAALVVVSLPCLFMTDTPSHSQPPVAVTEFSFDVRAEKSELISFAAERLLCNRPTKMMISVDTDHSLVFWLGYRHSKIEKVVLKNAPFMHGQPSADQLAELVK